MEGREIKWLDDYCKYCPQWGDMCKECSFRKRDALLKDISDKIPAGYPKIKEWN